MTVSTGTVSLNWRSASDTPSASGSTAAWASVNVSPTRSGTMRGAGPVDETTRTMRAGQHLTTSDQRRIVGDRPRDDGTGRAPPRRSARTSSTTRSSLASSVATSVNGRPVSSGSSRNVGPSLTMSRNGSPSVSSSPAAGAVRMTCPSRGSTSLRSCCTLTSHPFPVIWFLATGSSTPTRSGHRVGGRPEQLPGEHAEPDERSHDDEWEEQPPRDLQAARRRRIVAPRARPTIGRRRRQGLVDRRVRTH